MKPRDKRVKILLIDDDTDDLELMDEFLLRVHPQAVEYQLISAKTLESGIQMLSKELPDVILLDLMLPDSKGIETFLKLNKISPEIPIIIFSVLYDDALALEAVRRGAQDYLFKKETSFDLLNRTIRFAVERHRLRRELAKANSRLEKLALIDPVTELFNRRGLEEILSHEIQRAHRKHSNLLVMLVDLDDFKRINNALGHSVGDVVLKEVSIKLKTCLRPTDYVGRVGGDEFMVFFPDTLFEEGMRIAEKIRLAISSTVVSMTSVDDVKVTASLGLINLGMMNLSETEDSMNDLISKIHLFLHKSKQSGKNRISFEEHEISYDSLAEIPELLGDTNQYRVLMQPVLNLQTREVTAYEFLTRSAIKGFEMPDDFFRAALEANMLVKVDYECLRNAVRAASQVPPGISSHVNLYPSTLINLPMKIFLDLFDTGKKKNSFCIEISEQQIIGDPSYLLDAVNTLKKAGIQIAIDDLGFGRSCLESLILLEPDIVKIDKKCVIGISNGGAPIRSLKRLLKMAKSLGAEVVAEGLETQQDMDVLLQLGVKYGQGFYLGRPEPAQKIFSKSEIKWRAMS